MKFYSIFIISTLFVLTTSCGPSAQEKAATEKAKMDSVIKATEAASKQKMETQQLIEDSIKKASNFKEAMGNRLVSKKADLEVAKDKMNKIKEFHFGRTSVEREQQIKYQVVVIDSCEKEIERLNNNIIILNRKIEDLNTELIKYK